MYFCYAYNLSVYLVWFPKYLNDHRGFNLKQMGFYASMPLLAGTVGDVFGGWFSDLLAKWSGDLKTARRLVGAGGFLAFGTVYRTRMSHDKLACLGMAFLRGDVCAWSRRWVFPGQLRSTLAPIPRARFRR